MLLLVKRLSEKMKKSLWCLLTDVKMVALFAQNEDSDLLIFNYIKFDLNFHLETLPKHLGII